MESNQDNIIFDKINNIKVSGYYIGSIITKFIDDKILFSDNVKIEGDILKISKGLLIGFHKNEENECEAYSEVINFDYEVNLNQIEFSYLVEDKTMEKFDEGRFSEAFPFTITLLHTATLYLNSFQFKVNHLDFFKGEILKNAVALFKGICLSDRIVIDDNGDPIFYDALIIGRDKEDQISASYEPILNVDDKLLKYIIILGRESLKE
jgi:hypothetical protein